jgi:hypothetical protein
MESQAFSFKSQHCYETILEHWAKARIDTPLQIIARFDEAAKQLITIGGTLQGLLIAVFAFSTLQPRVSQGAILSIVFLLVAFIFCAARVICTLPPGMEAMGAYKLFRNIAEPGASDEELTKAIHKWCVDVENLARKKHGWLTAANVLFIVSFAVTLFLMFRGMQLSTGH